MYRWELPWSWAGNPGAPPQLKAEPRKHLSLRTHNVRNQGHPWNSTLPAECLLSRKYARLVSGVVHGLTALAPLWCRDPSVHVEPRHMLDPRLLPSQSPDANQSINNRDHASGSSFHNVTGNRHWSQQRKTLYTGVQEWRVALCTLAKTPPTPKSTPICLLFYWLALSVARKTLCCSWALSISFLFFFLFFFSFAFGALFPIPGEREMKTCQKRLFL